MLDRWRRSLPQYLTSAGHLALLFLAWLSDSREVWLGALVLVAAISAWAWLGTQRRYRAMADTPTSRIGSAAQGFVELAGLGRALPDQVVYSPFAHLPCLWYRYKAYRTEDRQRTLVEQGESDADFILDDGTGRCLLRPADAEIHTGRRDIHHRDGYRYEEEIIVAGERLYALGRFQSHGRHVLFDPGAELDQLLHEWKSDQTELARRFDKDGNGRLDPEEWQAAVTVARDEIKERETMTREVRVPHSLEPPGHGRPYLISNVPPESLARRYRYWTWAHGATLLAALAGAVMLGIGG